MPDSIAESSPYAALDFDSYSCTVFPPCILFCRDQCCPFIASPAKEILSTDLLVLRHSKLLRSSAAGRLSPYQLRRIQNIGSVFSVKRDIICPKRIIKKSCSMAFQCIICDFTFPVKPGCVFCTPLIELLLKFLFTSVGDELCYHLSPF